MVAFTQDARFLAYFGLFLKLREYIIWSLPARIPLTSQLGISEIFIHHTNNHPSVLAMGVVTNLLILVSVLSAFPWVRNNFHNVFEGHHRFAGWFVDSTLLRVIVDVSLRFQAWIDGHLGICTHIPFFLINMTPNAFAATGYFERQLRPCAWVGHLWKTHCR